MAFSLWIVLETIGRREGVVNSHHTDGCLSGLETTVPVDEGLCLAKGYLTPNDNAIRPLDVMGQNLTRI